MSLPAQINLYPQLGVDYDGVDYLTLPKIPIFSFMFARPQMSVACPVSLNHTTVIDYAKENLEFLSVTHQGVALFPLHNGYQHTGVYNLDVTEKDSPWGTPQLIKNELSVSVDLCATLNVTYGFLVGEDQCVITNRILAACLTILPNLLRGVDLINEGNRIGKVYGFEIDN